MTPFSSARLPEDFSLLAQTNPAPETPLPELVSEKIESYSRKDRRREVALTASEQLDKFNLDDHGDRHEHERWPLIRDRFGNYEIFWRLYVVPLTNRVLAPVAVPGRSWVRVRRDIPSEWQKLALCHYSVFYRLSRAVELTLEQASTAPDPPTHPEEVISLLQTCCENVEDFYEAVRHVSGDAVRFLPRRLPNDFPLAFRKIDTYRNLLIHNPVLGRGERHGETLWPKLPDDPNSWEAWKKKFRFSWSAVEDLSSEELVSARALLESLENDLAASLNETWGRILASLASRNPHERFKDFLRAPDSNDIITVCQPLAASGVFMK